MSRVRANTSFMVPGRRIVKTGEIFASDDPIIAGREALFSQIVEAVKSDDASPAREVVRSDSAPTKAPAKKAAAKSDD